MGNTTELEWLAPRGAADDRIYLRELARRVRDIAALPVMAERAARWSKHNALGAGRPMVLCFPEGSWVEILPESALRCTDPLHRHIERSLLSKIFHHEYIDDDQVIEATLSIGWKVTVGNFGFDVPYHHGDDRGSYVWDAPIKNLEDGLGKLKRRTLSVDRAATMEWISRARAIVGDLLRVRVEGSICWTLGLTWEAVKLIGLEQLMWAMVDEPQNLHKLMAFLRDEATAYIDWWEREGLITPNDMATAYVGSGGVGCVDELRGPARADEPVKLRQRWGFGESQETVGVSPAMFEEFILPYQVPLLERFGLTCYGCCEGLEHRIGHILRRVPRLRRVSVAPSADQEKMATALAGKYVFSRKVYPAHVCVGFNEPAVRADLRHTLTVARGQAIELILKDTHTLQNDVARLGRWVRAAREEIAAAT